MYIRTKDGRILDFDKLNEVSKLSIDMAEEPIREANTIEELCDEFVVNFECFNRSYYFIYKNSYDELKSDVQTFNYSAYGAIWTSKGLIYVAKMNDKRTWNWYDL